MATVVIILFNYAIEYTISKKQLLRVSTEPASLRITSSWEIFAIGRSLFPAKTPWPGPLLRLGMFLTEQ
jgi:hypothetical protein